MKIKRKLQQIIVYTVLSLFSVAVLYPLFWIGINSLKTNNEFYKNTFSLPGSLKWNNYVAAWKEGVGAYYLNSILVTGISVIAILLVLIFAFIDNPILRAILTMVFLIGGGISSLEN